ncbi:tetratricopeptide repeat protein [Sphingomonas sp. MMS24-JH45]
MDPFDRAVADAKSAMLAQPNRALVRRGAGAAHGRGGESSRAPAAAAGDGEMLRGEAKIRLGKPEMALPILTGAQRIAARAAPRSLLLADILLARGGALVDLGHTGEALPTLQHAHELYLELRQSRSQAKALILLALLYDYGRDHEGAALFPPRRGGVQGRPRAPAVDLQRPRRHPDQRQSLRRGGNGIPQGTADRPGIAPAKPRSSKSWETWERRSFGEAASGRRSPPCRRPMHCFATPTWRPSGPRSPRSTPARNFMQGIWRVRSR